MVPVKSPKKLIEVALPIDAINAACAREKSIRQGHPCTLHLWWARRPLAAARAVIFAQLVNDPSWKWEIENPGKIPPSYQKASWAKSRKHLFKIIKDLVIWENTTNEEVLKKAREEIRKSWREVCELNKYHPQANELFNQDKLPVLHDPFAGGGAIPLEAQRLGVEAYASDLNPVAVIINKAMIEVPPKFTGCLPVGPIPEHDTVQNIPDHKWPGCTGLAEDVRRYGLWMREEAQKRIGHLYLPIEITSEMAKERLDLKPLIGHKLTIIAWLWARTVKSPNPAFSHVDVPLTSTFVLSSKSGKEAYVEPIIDGDKYRFNVKIGKLPAGADNGTKVEGRGASFRCIISDTPISGDYIKAEGMAGKMGSKLIAVVVEGPRGRIYLSPTLEMETNAKQIKASWKPNGNVPPRLSGGTCVPYGMKEWGDLFTQRQLVALTTYSDLVLEASEKVFEDAKKSGMSDDERSLEAGGSGAKAYSEAVSLYLAMTVDKLTAFNCTLSIWRADHETAERAFGRQSIPMIWDYAENNSFSNSGGNFITLHESVESVIKYFGSTQGLVFQSDAQTQKYSLNKIISTDPPYYDNISYADLSDFFYVWLRRSLKKIFPVLLSTMAVPKAEELVATSYRHGSREKAESFFLDGMTRTIQNLSEHAHPEPPVTIYYAFKQSETESFSGTSSTGWETFLSALLKSGFSLTGTWPMRTEQTAALKSKVNALASSIVLVCRKRSSNAPTISRREFIRELNQVLPEALDEMTKGSEDGVSPVAPVDLSQAIIGPGMAIFSKYSAVLEADGTPMKVKTALQLINRFLAEDDFDHDTQFCLHWFEQYGWNEGVFGEADVLSRAKATSVAGLEEAGVLFSKGGKVHLRKWSEYPKDWNPATDNRLPVWEGLHQLIRILRQDGEPGAGQALASAKMRSMSESIRQLAYRLYTLCERKGWAEDARAYNELITSWNAIDIKANEFEANISPDQQGRFEGM